jgi:hypothetical protein
MTLQKFIPILKQQQSSDLNQKDFCQKNGITISIFNYWKKKILDGESSTNPFIELKNSAITPKPESFEIKTPRGYSVIVPVHFNSSELSVILETIG